MNDIPFPQAVEIEKMILGAILIERDMHDVVIPKLNADYFYNPDHAKLFDRIKKMYKKGIAIDIMTVAEECKNLKNIDAYFVASLTERIISSGNIETHITIILEKYIQRKLMKVCSEIYQNQTNISVDLIQSIDTLSNTLDWIDELVAGGTIIDDLKKLMNVSIKEAKKRTELYLQGKRLGIKTGFADLDKITNGWEPGDLIVLAGRPGMGKTSIVLKFAKAAAKDSKKVRFYSLEMTKRPLTDRLLLSECNIEAQNFRSGNLMDKDFKGLNKAEKKLEDLGIYIDDQSIRTIEDIRSNAKVWQRKGYCDLIIIDYLQLAEPSQDKKRSSLYEKTTEISRQAKIMAHEINCPVILVSQLNRAVENSNSKEPNLSDLRDSGAIEQDADKIILIFRPSYYGFKEFDFKGKEISSEGVGVMNIAKNRNGMTDKIRFQHNESLTKLYDWDNKNQLDKLLY